MEIEIKLGPVEPALAAKIFEDTALLPSAGEEQRIAMRTVYYDDPQGRLSAEKYTLRLRQENRLSVCTFKTPLRGMGRLELECEAPDIRQGAAVLAAQKDLPQDAAEILREGQFLPKCSAQFLRRTRLCRVEETVFHLCLDEGVLENGKHSCPLCELELELAEGPVEGLQRTANVLMQTFGLTECMKSKQQRAVELGQEGA